ncbi:MAG: hypothetical protein ACLVEU_08090 [Bacteroides cellulosilyticus]
MKKTLQGRRTGVGITAEGDMLAALGIAIRYGRSDRVLLKKYTKTVGSWLLIVLQWKWPKNVVHSKYTIQKREKNNPFINRLREADPELYDDMMKYGRRNIACLTIAPTGTTSLDDADYFGYRACVPARIQTSPQSKPNDTNVHVDFVDETGDAFEEYIVFHHKFVTWMEANGLLILPNVIHKKRSTYWLSNHLIIKQPQTT